MNKRISTKYAILSIRILLAAVYIFSGIVKAFDPMGTAIKIEEYLVSFSMEGLVFLSSTFSILLCAMELMIGLMLLLGLFKRIVSVFALLITFAFTLTTLYIFIENPVSDCGCFGDAIKLSNSETLYKNIVLLIMAFAVYIYYNKTEKWIDKTTLIKDIKYKVLLGVFCLAIPIYSTSNIPPVDFLPYQIGVNIPQAMEIPADAQRDEYEIKLIYKNIGNGDIIEFSDSDTTWYDSSKWEFVETKSRLLTKGFTPEIESFEITDINGLSVRDDVLSAKKIILLVFYTSDELENIEKHKIENFYNFADSTDSKIAILTYDDILTFRSVFEQKYRFTPIVYNADNVQLKSMIRQPKGAILLEDGTIISKKPINSTAEAIENMNDRVFRGLYLALIFLYLLIVVLLYYKKK